MQPHADIHQRPEAAYGAIRAGIGGNPASPTTQAEGRRGAARRKLIKIVNV